MGMDLQLGISPSAPQTLETKPLRKKEEKVEPLQKNLNSRNTCANKF